LRAERAQALGHGRSGHIGCQDARWKWQLRKILLHGAPFGIADDTLVHPQAIAQ
jgi:hypothetical protein